MFSVEFLKLAEDELQDAYEYYEYQQKNLGIRFIDEVYKSIELIKFTYHSRFVCSNLHLSL